MNIDIAALLDGSDVMLLFAAPALRVINDMSGNSVPSLGYAGTDTFANVFLTIGGASIIMM